MRTSSTGCTGFTRKSETRICISRRATSASKLWVTTTTGDAEGEITAHREVNVSREQLDAVLRNFTGELQQVPPMHSALKRDGKPLYAYARSGVTLEREPRKIVIHALRLLDFNDTRLTIDVSCSKGTYSRVLAEDIGAALGCGASLSGLRRTRVGSENVDQAVELLDRHAGSIIMEGRGLTVERWIEQGASDALTISKPFPT